MKDLSKRVKNVPRAIQIVRTTLLIMVNIKYSLCIAYNQRYQSVD